MRRAAWLAIALLSPFSQALATCPSDTRNTTPTVPNKGLPPDYLCIGCREQNRFWQDAHNSVWNYVKHGGGEFTYEYYFENLDRLGAVSQMPVRVCDPLGQCITVTVVTTFNTLISIGAKGVSIALRTSVQSYQLVSRLPSGASKVTIYMKSDMPKYPLVVPATPTDDGYTPGEDCLNNDGTARTSADNRPDGGHTGGGGGGGEPDTGTPNCGGTCPGQDK